MRKKRKSWFDEYDNKYQWLIEKCKHSSVYEAKKFNKIKQNEINEILMSFESIPNAYTLYRIIEIVSLNDNAINAYEQYKIAKKTNDKYTIILLTQGKNAAENHRLNVLNHLKKRGKSINPHCDEYYNAKGIFDQNEIDELKIKYKHGIGESLKSARASSKRNYESHVYNPYIEEFWLYRGYSHIESEDKINEMLKKTNCSLESMIDRHGEEIGCKLYNETKIKRKNTLVERYGRTNGFMPRVSKKSVKFFIPIYKFIRKLGIPRDDIHWGISGSREYVLNSNDSIHFYDFTIKSLKVIIEFNGLLFHPRGNILEWTSPLISDPIKKYENDQLKKQKTIDAGFNFIEIWEDDDLLIKQMEIKKTLYDLYNGSGKI